MIRYSFIISHVTSHEVVMRHVKKTNFPVETQYGNDLGEAHGSSTENSKKKKKHLRPVMDIKNNCKILMHSVRSKQSNHHHHTATPQLRWTLEGHL